MAKPTAKWGTSPPVLALHAKAALTLAQKKLNALAPWQENTLPLKPFVNTQLSVGTRDRTPLPALTWKVTGAFLLKGTRMIESALLVPILTPGPPTRSGRPTLPTYPLLRLHTTTPPLQKRERNTRLFCLLTSLLQTAIGHLFGLPFTVFTP